MAERDGVGAAWRVGQHYDIHVYEGDRPVATFHRPEDAAQAVADHNASPGGDADALAREVAELRNRERDALAMILFLGMCAGGRLKRNDDWHRYVVDRAESDAVKYARDRAEAAEARAVAAERERDEARAVLRRVEFEGPRDLCPCCLEAPPNHNPECDLAAALAPPRPSGAEVQSDPVLTRPAVCRDGSKPTVDEAPTCAGSASGDKGMVSTGGEVALRRANENADFLQQLRQARDMLADPDVDNWTKLKICEAVDAIKAAVDAALARRALAGQGAGREGEHG